MRIAVTGATGFVGSDIVRDLRAAGHSVVELVRVPRFDHSQSRHFDLTRVPNASILDDIDAVVHAAYVVAGRRPADAQVANIRGTLELFELAAARRLPFLFLSTLSALPEARSVYGRHKFELEGSLAPRGACIVRPGLVIGNGGLVRDLVQTMRRRRILPLIDGGAQPVQCVWRGDISAVIRVLVERRCPAATYTVAVEPALTVARLAADTRDAFNLKVSLINVPFAFAYGISAILERLCIPTPLPTENLLGLRASHTQPTTDLTPLDLQLTPWSEQLARLPIEFAQEPSPT